MRTFIIFKTSFYAFRNSWILNNESNLHVCNNTMKNRFINIKEVTSTDWLIIENKKLFIECFETISIIVAILNNLQLMILINVAYVSDFMINCVFQSQLKRRQMFFDEWKKHLHHKDKTLTWVKSWNEHYLMKNNLSSTFISSSSFIVISSFSLIDLSHDDKFFSDNKFNSINNDIIFSTNNSSISLFNSINNDLINSIIISTNDNYIISIKDNHIISTNNNVFISINQVSVSTSQQARSHSSDSVSSQSLASAFSHTLNFALESSQSIGSQAIQSSTNQSNASNHLNLDSDKISSEKMISQNSEQWQKFIVWSSSRMCWADWALNKLCRMISC